MYCAISVSRTARAAVYAGLPLPPGTSLVLGTPPNSLYCTQKSVSMISAAAAKRRSAASPGVSRPLFSSSADADALWDKSPAPTVATPAATPFLRKPRRVEAEFPGRAGMVGLLRGRERLRGQSALVAT